ncbi:MAG: histidine kinase [Flavipsychrobacter sp.]|nr:histidine kinase [Flavipsychrobacter sp.]
MRYLWLCILVAVSVAAQAQRPFSRDFRMGESQSPVNVNAIAESPSGYIWVGTDEGLFRFNGRDFVKITDSANKGVTALAALGSEVYAGYADGTLACLADGVLRPVGKAAAGPRSRVQSITAAGAGLLWLCTEEGVYLYAYGRYFRISGAQGLADNFTYQLVAKGASCVVGTDNGVSYLRFVNDTITARRYGIQDGLPDNIISAIKAVPGTSAYWAGTHEGGAFTFRLDTNGMHGVVAGYASRGWGQVNDIFAVSATEAWAVTEAGYLLHLRAGDSLSVVPLHFAGKKIRRLLYVRSGNLWLATNEGLTVVTISHASYHIAGAPYFFSTLTALTGGDGRMWLAQGRELLSLHLSADTVVPAREAMLPAAITCMYLHGGQGIWLGTFGRGLWHYIDGRLRQVKGPAGMDNANILSIAAYNSRLWVASLNGVDELDVSGDKMVPVAHYNKAGGIGSDYVYQLYNDGRGRLWLATDGGGVAMYDGRRFHRWDSTSGLTARVVYSIAVDSFGHAWAGTPDKGVFRYDGRRWQQFTLQNGLQDMNVSSVMANNSGQVIVVTQKGVDEWFPGSGLFRRFNKKTNLDIEHTSAVLNCMARDAAGNVYVPFDKGFISFTNVSRPLDIRPGISVNEVRLFFKPVSYRSTFGHDENQLSFQYEGINYSNIERLHYRYRLEGYQNEWIYTDDETVTFSRLPAGTFHFRIQASLDMDFEEANEAVYTFRIRAPFWKAPWFLVLSVGIVFGLLYAYIKARERSLRKVNELQEERLKFEYELLRSQVNPHFLFNSLNTLSALIEEDKDKAVQYTSQLSDLYRSVLAHKDMDLITLGEELRIIERYMFVQQSRFGDALRLSVSVPEAVMKSGKVVPLALQILVENAIKHNTVSRSAPLVIYIEADELQVTVRNELKPKITKEKGEGLGLHNIRKRYSLLTKRPLVNTIADNQYVVSLPLL